MKSDTPERCVKAYHLTSFETGELGSTHVWNRETRERTKPLELRDLNYASKNFLVLEDPRSILHHSVETDQNTSEALSDWLYRVGIAGIGTKTRTERIIPAKQPGGSSRRDDEIEMIRRQFKAEMKIARDRFSIKETTPITLTTLQTPEVVDKGPVLFSDKQPDETTYKYQRRIVELREGLSAKGLFGLLRVLKGEE